MFSNLSAIWARFLGLSITRGPRMDGGRGSALTVSGSLEAKAEAIDSFSVRIIAVCADEENANYLLSEIRAHRKCIAEHFEKAKQHMLEEQSAEVHCFSTLFCSQH